MDKYYTRHNYKKIRNCLKGMYFSLIENFSLSTKTKKEREVDSEV